MTDSSRPTPGSMPRVSPGAMPRTAPGTRQAQAGTGSDKAAEAGQSGQNSSGSQPHPGAVGSGTVAGVGAGAAAGGAGVKPGGALHGSGSSSGSGSGSEADASIPSNEDLAALVPDVSLPQADPQRFGRIDPDGRAFVTQAGQERQIGVWQAGTVEEGYAHFANRFDDIATAISLLFSRLKVQPEHAQQVLKDAMAEREALPEAKAMGDVAALDQALADLIAAAEQVQIKVRDRVRAQRAVNIARKEQLAAEAEDLAANATNWKAAGDRLRDILDEWRQIRIPDRAKDNALWERYSKARSTFNRRRGAFFSDMDKQRAECKRVKQDIVERAEALQDSTEWRETGQAFSELMREWKAAGRAHREVEDKLWKRFSAAQDKFFSARRAQRAEQDKQFEGNAAAKQALLDEYDAKIAPHDNLAAAKSALHELQDKWEEIGFVPRDQVREFENKISALEQRVADAEADEWRRTDPEVQARVAQFQDRADQLLRDAQSAEDKGDAGRAQQLREQAQQWQEWAATAAEALD